MIIFEKDMQRNVFVFGSFSKFRGKTNADTLILDTAVHCMLAECTEVGDIYQFRPLVFLIYVEYFCTTNFYRKKNARV